MQSSGGSGRGARWYGDELAVVLANSRAGGNERHEAGTCAYPGCPDPVDAPGGAGRPPTYCTEHRNKASSKRAVRLARLAPDPCCADAKRANPRVRTCRQHQQWRKFIYQARARRGTGHDLDLYTDMLGQFDCDEGEATFRLACNDSYLPESAEDRRDRKQAEEFIAAKAKTLSEGECGTDRTTLPMPS